MDFVLVRKEVLVTGKSRFRTGALALQLAITALVSNSPRYLEPTSRCFLILHTGGRLLSVPYFSGVKTLPLHKKNRLFGRGSGSCFLWYSSVEKPILFLYMGFSLAF